MSKSLGLMKTLKLIKQKVRLEYNKNKTAKPTFLAEKVEQSVVILQRHFL